MRALAHFEHRTRITARLKVSKYLFTREEAENAHCFRRVVSPPPPPPYDRTNYETRIKKNWYQLFALSLLDDVVPFSFHFKTSGRSRKFESLLFAQRRVCHAQRVQPCRVFDERVDRLRLDDTRYDAILLRTILLFPQRLFDRLNE